MDLSKSQYPSFPFCFDLVGHPKDREESWDIDWNIPVSGAVGVCIRVWVFDSKREEAGLRGACAVDGCVEICKLQWL